MKNCCCPKSDIDDIAEDIAIIDEEAEHLIKKGR